MATLEYPVEKLMDKYGKKYFLFSGYLLATVVIFGYMFVENVMQLFILQVLMSIAFAIGDPSWDAWFSDIITKKSSGFDWAVFHMIAGYSAGFSALIGGAVAKYLGFSMLFFIGGMIAIFSAFTVLSIKEARLGSRRRGKQSEKIHHRGHGFKRCVRIKNSLNVIYFPHPPRVVCFLFFAASSSFENIDSILSREKLCFSTRISSTFSRLNAGASSE